MVHHSHRDRDDKKCVEPVVGAHGMNFTLFTNIPELRTDCYGVETYHADGTWIFHGSEFLTQSVGGNQGALSTVLIGAWKKTGKRTYKVTGEFVQLLRDPVNPALPAVPTYRWKVDLVQKIDRNGIDGSWSGVATPHPKDDLTLSLPAPPPITGLVLEASGVTKKVTVCHK
jgi:hypothetical protein